MKKYHLAVFLTFILYTPASKAGVETNSLKKFDYLIELCDQKISEIPKTQELKEYTLVKNIVLDTDDLIDNIKRRVDSKSLFSVSTWRHADDLVKLEEQSKWLKSYKKQMEQLPPVKKYIEFYELKSEITQSKQVCEDLIDIGDDPHIEELISKLDNRLTLISN